MYKWRIVYHLTNGKELAAMYVGTEKDSKDVAAKLYNKKSNSDIVATYGQDENHGLLVRMGDVAAIDISKFEE